MHKKWLSPNGYAWKGHMIKWLCGKRLSLKWLCIIPKMIMHEQGHLIKWLCIEKGCHWNDCA